MTGPQPGRHAVGLDPLARVLPVFLQILAPWAVILAGRQVCLLAQRIPPLVRLVRLIARRMELRS